MVEHSGIALSGFDQDLWARMGDYASRVAQESLDLFRLLRSVNLQFLQQLAPEQWECFGIHAERGRITVRNLATHMAGHDANHVEANPQTPGLTREPLQARRYSFRCFC